MSRVVAPGRAMRLSYGIVLRQLITRGRIAALVLVGAVVTAVAFAVGVTERGENDHGDLASAWPDLRGKRSSTSWKRSMRCTQVSLRV